MRGLQANQRLLSRAPPPPAPRSTSSTQEHTDALETLCSRLCVQQAKGKMWRNTHGMQTLSWRVAAAWRVLYLWGGNTNPSRCRHIWQHHLGYYPSLGCIQSNQPTNQWGKLIEPPAGGVTGNLLPHHPDSSPAEPLTNESLAGSGASVGLWVSWVTRPSSHPPPTDQLQGDRHRQSTEGNIYHVAMGVRINIYLLKYTK